MFAFFGLGNEELNKLANCSTCMMFPLTVATLIVVAFLLRHNLKRPRD